MTTPDLKTTLSNMTVPATLQLNPWTFIFDLPKAIEITIARAENSDVDLELLNEIIEKLNETNNQ